MNLTGHRNAASSTGEEREGAFLLVLFRSWKKDLGSQHNQALLAVEGLGHQVWRVAWHKIIYQKRLRVNQIFLSDHQVHMTK